MDFDPHTKGTQARKKASHGEKGSIDLILPPPRKIVNQGEVRVISC